MSAIFKRILNDKKQVNLTRITNLKEEKIFKKKITSMCIQNKLYPIVMQI